MINLDDHQRMLVRALNDIVENEFSARACQWDGDVPWENIQTLADQDFFGINIPEEYGGGGMSDFEALLCIETVGTVCPDTAYVLFLNTMVATRAIQMFGSDEIKKRYLTPTCNGEFLIAIAISEPEAGSDVGSMKTHLVKEDGEYYLNGEKIWVSYVPESEAAVVWTKFPDGNIGSVIMDFDADGVEINEHYTNMANQTQTHFFMNDVHIPGENVLMHGREAFKQQLRSINWERCGAAALSVSMARCALKKALEYAQEREQFGRSLSEFQGMRWKLADMARDLESARTLTYRAVSNAVENEEPPDRLETSLAKLESAVVAERVVSESLQVFGATGYMKEHALEYLYRLQRGRRLAAGTDEMMKNGIADLILEDGLPDLF